jgi:hypothetical protein
MKTLSQAVIAKSESAFLSFGKVAAQHTVSADHAVIAEVRAALPRDARAHYSALSPVGRVAMLMQDDVTARDIFIADGNAFEVSQGRFFLSSVALFLRMGDESARGVVRDAWADSKDKRREYALKIFRMCAKAIEAGQVDGLRAVTGFASLQALQPKKEPVEKAAIESTPVGAPTLTGAPSDAEQAARAEQVAGAQSRAAEIAAQLARIAEVSEALSSLAAADNAYASLAALAADLNVSRASLESLTA